MKSADAKTPGPSNQVDKGTATSFFHEFGRQSGGAGVQTVQRTPAFESSEPEAADGPFFSAIQPKLEISEPGDPLEVQADAVADRVVDQLHAGSSAPVGDISPTRSQGIARASSGSSPAASGLNLSGGGGSPLPQDTRTSMESSFGADFSGVRVHDDDAARQMSTNISAKAFTHGQDIYFSGGSYNPGTQAGDRLLAHELAHVVQQSGGARRIDRTEDTTGDSDQKVFSVSGGNYDGTTFDITNRSHKKLLIKKAVLRLPDFKKRNRALFDSASNFDEGGGPNEFRRIRARNSGQRDTDQDTKWRKAVKGTFKKRLKEKLKEAADAQSISKKGQFYFFALNKGDEEARIMGTEEQLETMLEVPFWDKEGKLKPLQIDHIVENQIFGKDYFGNYELLEAKANASAGSSLAHEISGKISGARTALIKQNKALDPKKKPAIQRKIGNPKTIRRKYEVNFAEAPTFNLRTTGEGKTGFWSRGHITKGRHIDLLRPLNAPELSELTDEKHKNRKRLFLGPFGGHSVDLDEPEDLGDGFPLLGKNVDRVLLKSYKWDEGTLEVQAFSKKKKAFHTKDKNLTWRTLKIPGTAARRLDRSSVAGTVRNSLRLPGLSPIRLDTVDVVPNLGLVGQGKLLPTVPLIKDADIDVILTGQTLRLQKTFDLSEIKLPKPFNVTESSITVFLENNNLGASGMMALTVDKVGEGEVKAKVSTAGGFELQGRFNFDSKLFSKAEIRAAYKEEKWSFGGTLAIEKGKVRGVDSAEISVDYADEILKANGEAKLGVPGIESGTMNMALGPAGFKLGGQFNLKSDIPGIKSGSVNATLKRAAETGEWSMSAGGKAVPSIPGIETELSIQYDNGIITISGAASYKRGLLAGSVLVGATNRAVDDQGKPTGEAAEELRAFGGGALTIKLTPWLAATAGVKFLENGELEVQGKLGIPKKIDVFKRRAIKKPLFIAPSIQIPIFAIPLGPKSIGIVAEIGGGLHFEAGFGPGELRDLSAEITYNPDHEDQTVITGKGRFVVPADASLILRADVGLGASLAIASLTGGLEIEGALGLKAEAAAGIDVNWSPGTGIELKAEAKAEVQPKFRFAINAFARAKLDLWIKTLSKTWRKKLTGFEWGPGMKFGIRFPVHYKEGQPFDISYRDIQLTYPKLNITDMAKRLGKDIKNKVF